MIKMEQEQQIIEEQDKNVNKSSDSVNARREARRKRILENSNNRLTKITGREHDEPNISDHSEFH